MSRFWRTGAGKDGSARELPEGDGTRAVLELRDVHKRFEGPPPVHALRGCSLLVRPGEHLAIMGPSGSGKSTVLGIAGLLASPSSGECRIDGDVVEALSDDARSQIRAEYVGFVFQDSHLVAHRTCLENVELALLYQGVRRDARQARSIAALEHVGLSHRLGARPNTLSGGEAQRVAIARALVKGPLFVLCDEPTGALDSANAGMVMGTIDELNASGCTVVTITHEQRVADHARRVVSISDGRITDDVGPARVGAPTDAVAAGEASGERPNFGPIPGRARTSDLCREAVSSVDRRPGRTILTAMGTVLGVCALVVTLGLSATASAQISSAFDQLAGTEVTFYDAGGSGSAAPFPADAEERLDRLNGVVHSGLLWTLPAKVSARNPRHWQADTGEGVQVMAASPGLFDVVHARLATGRLFDRFHRSRDSQVVVLGSAAAAELGVTWVNGRSTVLLGSRPFQVVGVLADAERRPDLLFAAIVPDTTALSIWGVVSQEPMAVIVETAPGAAQLIGSQGVLTLSPEDPDRLGARVPPDPRALRERVASDVRALLLGFAVLSLGIGAFQIANTSLVSVLERVAEIGLRRALGARRRDIAAQFLVEGALVGAIGGLVGACLGLVAVMLVAAARGWAPVMEVGWLVIAPFLGAGVGMIAGLYPAWRAGRLDPMEALRSP